VVAPQSWQAPPAVPQLASEVPVSQAVPSQQPAQVLDAHVPPHPSLAHLPAQSGAQTQLPSGPQVRFGAQEPHVPPHPSLPHCLF